MADYCSECGEKLSADDKYCPGCGRELLNQPKNKKSKSNNILNWSVLLLMIFLGFVFFYPSSEDDPETTAVNTDAAEMEKQPEQNEDQANKSVPLPSFEIVDEETQDTPLKTQVEQHILVTNRIEPENLRALLNSQYKEIMSRSGFQHGSQVTNAYIYVYDSQERANQKGYSWIASLQKGQDQSPRIQIKEDQIEINKQGPEEKFGFSEEERKDIFWDLVSAQDRAYNESIERAPDDWEKQIEIEGKLTEQYEQNVADKYSISTSTLDSISVEGVTKQWPKPEL